MKLLQYLPVKSGRVLAWVGLGLAAVLLAGGRLSRGSAQDKASTPEKKEAPASSAKGAATAPGTNAPAAAAAKPAVRADTAGPGTNVPALAGAVAASAEKAAGGAPAARAPAAEPGAGGTNAPAGAQGEAEKGASSDEVQLSLMGANVDMVVQWLAQNTGKTVIKSPKVQCQLMITSSKKLPKRAAITLVYRALASKGFSVTETSNAIYITPEGQEPKMNPELLEPGSKDIPDGHQRLVKIFRLRHIAPAELKEKVRAVLSDKGVIEVDDGAKQLIVTDYNENLRLLGELIKDFDLETSDTVIRNFSAQIRRRRGGGQSHRHDPQRGGGGRRFRRARRCFRRGRRPCRSLRGALGRSRRRYARRVRPIAAAHWIEPQRDREIARREFRRRLHLGVVPAIELQGVGVRRNGSLSLFLFARQDGDGRGKGENGMPIRPRK